MYEKIIGGYSFEPPLWTILVAGFIGGLLICAYAMAVAWRVRKTHKSSLLRRWCWFAPEVLLWVVIQYVLLFDRPAANNLFFKWVKQNGWTSGRYLPHT
jgi:hypothetical protein